MEQLHQNILEGDIEVFLQEADEHLQLMDQDVVQLESDPENPDLLQQIFRSSHTIKGSSAMLGHARMTEVAHSMENLLDRLRKGSATVTTGVIDVLLHSLDTLRALKDELTTRAPAAVDVAKLVEDVEFASREAATDPAERDASSAGADGGQAATATTPITRQVRERVRGLMASGSGAFSVEATVVEGTDWTAVRLFQVHSAVSALSEVVVSWPSMDQIQAEEVERSIRLLVCCQADEQDLAASLEQVEDLENVQVVSWDPEAEPEEGEEEAGEAGAQQATASEGADAGTAGQDQAKAPARQQTVRVDVERIDHMMNTVGELIIDRTRIVQIGKALEARYKDDDFVRALGETSAHIVKVIDELQESTMKVRMLPIGTVFGSFPRLIRDLSQSIDKKVEFTIEGAETEIDRTIVDRVRDPLIHLLRNAVDHGMETPEEREAAGKPAMGHLRLSAFQEQGHIAITVQDDGRGMDPEKIRKAAIKKGLVTEEIASRLSDREALDLIFLPGSSTAAKTTEISGRGVGMDIVKTNIEAINGFVSVETELGKGSVFTLKMPLSLATLQTLLVGVKQTTFAVPLVHVLQTVMVKADEISTIAGRGVTTLRGSLLPLLELGETYGSGNATRSRTEDSTVVVVQLREKLVGLVVDELLGNEEILVKSLGRFVGDVKGLAGASIMADGRVVLIVDVPTLLSSYFSHGVGSAEVPTRLEAVRAEVEPDVENELPELAVAS